MNKNALHIFRNVFANLIIVFILAGLFSFTYVGGVLHVFSSSTYDPIYHGNLNNRNVSLMINVYWGTEFIEPMLEIFEQKNVKVTFFVGGSWVQDNSELLIKMYQKGHEIGNHGYFHKDHKQLSYERNKEEILATHSLVKGFIGYEMNLFAPPSGSFSHETLEVAQSLGYKTIMWTKDTIDWRDRNQSLIYSRAIKNPKNGDLILMHPIKETVLALPDIIDFYLEKGFKLVSVSENLM